MPAHKMSNEMRALRLSQLSKIIPQYVVPHLKSDHPEGNDDSVWALRFPTPKVDQFAMINMATGIVLSFYRQVGASSDIVKDPDLYLSTIDRRINYLWQTHKHELEGDRK